MADKANSEIAALDLGAIKVRVANRNDVGAMESACGEYNCSCHYDIPALLAEIDRLRAKDEAAATALAQLQSDIDKFWKHLHRSWDIEPRKYFEEKARINGFDSPLAMAVHYMWKRDTKVTEARSKAFDDAIAIVERERERVLSITERTSYGDGRLDAASILAGALTAARDKKAEVDSHG